MGVDLGRRQRGVAEYLLHAAQVRTALQQVRRGSVPQAVRSHVRHRRRGRDPGVHDPAYGARVDPPPVRRGTGPPLRWRPRVPRGRLAASGPRLARPGCRGAPRRSFAPLPSTRTVRRLRSRSSTSSPHSSLTRTPVAYSNSMIAVSRSSIAAATWSVPVLLGPAASTLSISSTASTSGSTRLVFGLRSWAAGLAASRPRSCANAVSDLAAAPAWR